jgi:hypothetical protein
LGKHKLSPLEKIQAENRLKAQRSAARANAKDERFAEIVKGFPDTADPESLARIKEAGDKAAAERDQRIADHRAQLKGGQ